MDTSEIVETLSKTRLPPPETVFVLDAPIVYPQRHSLVLGLNPQFQRATIVVGGNATKETVIHETLHRIGLGEILTYPLARIMAKRMEDPVFPGLREKLEPNRQIRYTMEEVDSSEMEQYGLHSLVKEGERYTKGKVKVKKLKLIH